MADIVFYEKVGCSGNARQKMLLTASGHKVLSRDLRREPWTRMRLLSFFADLPVPAWFNRNAPAIKSGQIIPETLDEIAALTLLIEQPLLIRRPLLEVAGERRVGFDVATIREWIGLAETPPAFDAEACVHVDGGRCADEAITYVHTVSGGALPCPEGAEASTTDRHNT
jgi:nitrogenase-associated protein